VFPARPLIQQHVLDQQPAGACIGSQAFRFPVICQHGDFSMPRYTEPGPTTAQVPPGKDLWRIFPEGSRSRRTIIEFVTIAGKNERIPWM
jgi:hypothetical protein